MPARRNLPITAGGLLHDLSAQLDRFLIFLEVDLTPALAETGATSDVPIAVDFISRGTSSRLWILRIQTALRWSSMALEEERWLRMQGLDGVPAGNHMHGVWSMPSFLRHLGRSKDHNARSDLQQGRKLRRFENEFGEGITFFLAVVLPSFRRLSLREEAKAIRLLRTTHTNILVHVQRFSSSKHKYQKLVRNRIFSRFSSLTHFIF